MGTAPRFADIYASLPLRIRFVVLFACSSSTGGSAIF